MILFLERGEAGVGTWLEAGCFQTQPLEGEVASHLGQPLTRGRKGRMGLEMSFPQQPGRGQK